MTAITLDYAGCLTDRIGPAGLDPDALAEAEGRLRAITRRFNEGAAAAETDEASWRDLPLAPQRTAMLAQIEELVAPRRGRIDQIIVLGIGGSALSNRAIDTALAPREGPRLVVLDNIDPDFIGRALDAATAADPGLRRTLVNVISKSGETAETAAQLLVVRPWLEAALGDTAGKHIVAITDPREGTLRRLADREGYDTLEVPPGVGGRFSVFSAVGLFSAAMTGVDIDAMLRGAEAMELRCREEDPTRNPAAVLAWILTSSAAQGRRNHVLMSYAQRLMDVVGWYRQLWAESLGKTALRDGVPVPTGATPIGALGASDQHSQLQLYREGPDDKVIGFLEVEHFERDIPIPAEPGLEPLAYLGGHSLGSLLRAERRATEYALALSKRPTFTIRFPRLDAAALGQFFQLWMNTTVYAGALFGVDPYGQPAVETGKHAAFGLMGRAGYEEWPAKIDEVVKPSAWVV